MNHLVVNSSNTNFYNHLKDLLNSCDSFIFNVAFINYSGIQLLLDTFKSLEKKKVKGKILSSTYLNFTQAKALEKIQEFENIELKIFICDKVGFHAKSYIFDFKDEYKILLGSSNITASAFKSNIEWNIKTISKKDALFTKELLEEFDLLWLKSNIVNKEFLQEYKAYEKQIENPKTFSFNKTLHANKMQEKALARLDYLRANNQNKALAIAATGSGKTYLAAFDVKNFCAKKMLFIVHRENILLSAKSSFEKLFTNRTCGLFTGNKKELKSDFIFSTIQSLNNNYKYFKKDLFDYIIVDEAHHISSPSYKKILNYFETKFLLGLTATPNRMDDENIYELFDENIACDIRLNDALDEDLISSFHYYGIEDISSIDYGQIDLNKIDKYAKLFMINKRVEYIIEKMNFYSYSGNKRRVLGFCVSKEHAFYMSEEFNKKGIKSISLTSEDSILKREKAIKDLEDLNSSLEVIFTVDIFNEGIDIPCVNTILMLRPTNSPIVFMQQLGRGLRKQRDKEFLTLLDFIGNHNKAYLVSLALLGNKVIDKDSIKLSLINDFANIKNAFINMGEISKQRIIEQINKENFSSMKILKDLYFEFKYELGRRPKLLDFINNEYLDPLRFISESKSYMEFIFKVEKNEDLKDKIFDETFRKALRFIESLLPIKRPYEFVALKYLLSNKSIDIKEALIQNSKFLQNASKESIEHSFRFLNQDFFDKAQISRFEKLVDLKANQLYKTKVFESLLENEFYKSCLEDSINYALLRYEKEFSFSNYGLPFLKIYEKYNMLNIAQLCNFDKIHSSFRGSGFLKFKDDFFLFITIEKDKFTKASKYENAFLSKDKFTYSSKPSHSKEKGDGQRLVLNQEFGVKLHIFVRKFAQVDKKTQAFIYLGLANTISYKNDKPIDCILQLEKPLSNKLYDEFTTIV